MEEIPSSLPPEDFHQVDEWILDKPGELTTLRASLHQALTGKTLEQGTGLARIPEKLVLVASELATNALKHGIPPTIVRLLSDGTDWLLDVADHDVDGRPYIAGQRAPGQGGFGLFLADQLSLSVGWYQTEDTKNVWARFGTESTQAVPSADQEPNPIGTVLDPRSDPTP
ncbi:ATP-binding protein [Actinotalea sp. BY-33]|uniref:ATP-binding protein n=1 Tax=Actinotalea soli TaxID=2819234 RepID=A0A939RVQ3_9CELL|nr:ATP-binding protein [Actinotalea soli]MBO1751376.1 ATP-binding protein [Actinotalea soli]